jgi:hypothetical protein
MSSELVKHVEYLNDMVNRERAARDQAEETLARLGRRVEEQGLAIGRLEAALAQDEPRAKLERMTNANGLNLARADEAERRLALVREALGAELDD